MRCYTSDECADWLAGRERVKPDTQAGLQREILPFPSSAGRMLYVARWIATQTTYREPVLLWLTEWGVWPSSENWHLYYRLRQSYGDSRLLHEAPGHYFLDYEMEDLASFLQLTMLCGWDGYVLTGANYVNTFISHDEFIDFYAADAALLAETRAALGEPQQKS